MTDTLLPPRNPTHWTANRKAAVVRAVHAGHLAWAEACERYDLSHDELVEWERDYRKHGVGGLYVTKDARRGGRR